jgi:hypothetical protein
MRNPVVVLRRSMSCSGTSVTRSTSPDSSAAMRVGADAIGV